MSDLGRLAIGIRTFLRDPQLVATIEAIRDTMPEVQMIIADCGEMTSVKDQVYENLIRVGHKVIKLDFDAGFGKMGNAIIDACDKEFVMPLADDFDFRPNTVREGICELMRVLEMCDVDVASGRVNNLAYEFLLEEYDGKVKEIPVRIEEPKPRFTYVDLTVNYTMFKRRVFEKVRWDDDAPIAQGEHGSLFLDIKHAGFKVAYVSGVGIAEQKLESSDLYKYYRRRTKGRSCFVKRGIREYVLGSGAIDYRAS